MTRTVVGAAHTWRVREPDKLDAHMMHALTIDVEDYHCNVGRDYLEQTPTPTKAVVENTHRFLELFARRDVRGTFFTLGEIAEAFPELIREIADAGHELGVHGYYHAQVFKLSPEAFRKEVADAKALLEDLSGQRVRGHRAPAFSVRPDTSWALDVLAEAGFDYDSSVFPIRGKRYGWPGFRPDIHRMDLAEGRQIVEAPMSTITLMGKQFPACGGGYLRHFPVTVTAWAIKRVQKKQPAILYMHPHEIETSSPPVDTSHLSPEAASRAKRFDRLQRRNRHTFLAKVDRLITRFEFGPLAEVIDATLSHAS